MSSADTELGGYRHLPLFAYIVTALAFIFSLFGLVTTSFEEPPPENTTVPAPAKPFYAWLLSIIAFLSSLAACAALFRRIDRKGLGANDLEWPVTRTTKFALVALSASSVLTITNCLVYSLLHPLPPLWEFSEAFYNTLQSGLLALGGVAILALDWLWTPDFAHSGSGLSPIQQRVVLSVVTALVYASLLSLIFAVIERWSYRDAMFFTLTTLTTIGFGSPRTPAHPVTRILVILCAGVGIALVAFCVKSIADALDEALREGVMLRWRRMRKRGGEQVGYTQLSVIDEEDGEVEKRGIGARFLDALENGWDWISRKVTGRSKDGPSDAATDVEMSAVLATNAAPHAGVHAESANPAQHAQLLLLPNFRRRFISSALSLLIFWLLSSTLFYFTERLDQSWTPLDALYFTFIAFTTIGYGDYYPKSNSGLALFNMFVFVGIAVLTYFATTAAFFVRAVGDPEGFEREVRRMQEEEERRMRKRAAVDEVGEEVVEGEGEEGNYGDREKVVSMLAGLRTLPADLRGNRDRAIEALEGLLASFLSPGQHVAAPTPVRIPTARSSPTRAPLSPFEYPPLAPPTMFSPSRTLQSPANRTVEVVLERVASGDSMGEFQGAPAMSPPLAGADKDLSLGHGEDMDPSEEGDPFEGGVVDVPDSSGDGFGDEESADADAWVDEPLSPAAEEPGDSTWESPDDEENGVEFPVGGNADDEEGLLPRTSVELAGDVD